MIRGISSCGSASGLKSDHEVRYDEVPFDGGSLFKRHQMRSRSHEAAYQRELVFL